MEPIIFTILFTGLVAYAAFNLNRNIKVELTPAFWETLETKIKENLRTELRKELDNIYNNQTK